VADLTAGLAAREGLFLGRPSVVSELFEGLRRGRIDERGARGSVRRERDYDPANRASNRRANR
jgi:hypothetical protein